MGEVGVGQFNPAGWTHGGRGGRPHHVFDGPDGGNRILGVRKSHGHRAGQFAAEVDRATAHALHNAGVIQGTTRKPSQNQRLLGPHAIEDAQNLHLELLDLASREDRPAGAVHARAYVFKGKKGGLRSQPRGKRQNGRNRPTKHILL